MILKWIVLFLHKSVNMKLIVFVFLFTISAMSFSQSKFNLKVTALNAPSKEVKISAFGSSNFQTQKLALENNVFNVSMDLKQLEFLKIAFDDNSFVVLIAEPNQSIEMNFDMKYLIETISVKGSKHTSLIYENDRKLLPYQIEQKKIVEEFNKLKSQDFDNKLQVKYQAKLDSVKKLEQNHIIDLIKQNYSSPSNLFLIERLNIENNIELYQKVLDELIKKYPKHHLIEQFKNRVLVFKNTAIGSKVPNIVLESINGYSLSLFPINANLVLIDFWASWCAPCRKSNPAKVELYNKYKDEGFIIFSVSLDQVESAWKSAIVSDKLNWNTHVSDLKGWQSKTAADFGVNSIPANFLLDRDGRILAKNLRGRDLELFIENYLKNK